MSRTQSAAPLDSLPDALAQDPLGAMRTCCDHAREAAIHGRLRAAHGLFQTALLFFESARLGSAPDDETLLSGALIELDALAIAVYPVDSAEQFPVLVECNANFQWLAR